MFQVLLPSDAFDVLHPAKFNTDVLLERDLPQLLLHSRSISLRLHLKYDVASELCRSSFRQQTLRQVS